MGCIMSSPAAVQAPVPEKAAAPVPEKPAAPEPEKAAAPKEKPKPLIFGLMRNAHEVIRGAQRDLKQEIFENEDIDSARKLHEKLIKFTMMHMWMEEGSGTDKSPIGMFRVLDKHCQMIAEEEHLYDLHVSLEKKEHALADAFEGSDLEAVQSAFTAFDEFNLAHLKKEEAVMMPRVMEMAKSGISLKKVMVEELLPMVTESLDFEFFVKFANEILEKHPENMPRVRVFDHALWAVSTADDWKKYDKWIKETLKPETYQEVQDAINA